VLVADIGLVGKILEFLTAAEFSKIILVVGLFLITLVFIARAPSIKLQLSKIQEFSALLLGVGLVCLAAWVYVNVDSPQAAEEAARQAVADKKLSETAVSQQIDNAAVESSKIPPILAPASLQRLQWPYLKSNRVTPQDLEGLGLGQLRLLRNEIYARNGYIFKDAELLNYFDQQLWYQRSTTEDNAVYDAMDNTEKFNVKALHAYEQKLRSSL
jgi:YARHG domain